METDMKERRSALDEFAQATAPSTGTDLVSVSMAPPPEPIYGSRQVADQRDERRVLLKIRTLAAAAGADWYYRFPVKNRKKGTTEWIEGPSIKMANDLARLYGNCHIDCRAQDFGSVILYHARFWDVESGYSLTRPFQQRKSAGKLGGDAERNEDIAFQIGASKSIRNVTVNALQTFADYALEEAKQAAVDKIGSDIERYRRVTAERAAGHVAIERVEAVVGRPVKEWLAPDVARVIAMMKAVSDGMASLDETFPPQGDKDTVDETTGEITRDALDAFAGNTDGEALAEPETPSPNASADPAAAGATGNEASAAVLPKVQEVVFKLLQLATDTSITPQERIENLDMLTPTYEDALPGSGEFVRTAVQTAAKVAQGQLKVDAARTYLLGLFKP